MFTFNDKSIIYYEINVDLLKRTSIILSFLIKLKKKHEKHLREIFNVLFVNNIFIKLIKIFIEYLFVFLLNQKMNFFDLIIVKKKLLVIFRFRFFRFFQLLKTYLKFIE